MKCPATGATHRLAVKVYGVREAWPAHIRNSSNNPSHCMDGILYLTAQKRPAREAKRLVGLWSKSDSPGIRNCFLNSTLLADYASSDHSSGALDFLDLFFFSTQVASCHRMRQPKKSLCQACHRGKPQDNKSALDGSTCHVPGPVSVMHPLTPSHIDAEIRQVGGPLPVTCRQNATPRRVTSPMQSTKTGQRTHRDVNCDIESRSPGAPGYIIGGLSIRTR